jgi:hypothetical protein
MGLPSWASSRLIRLARMSQASAAVMSRLRCPPSRSACANFASACAWHSTDVSIPPSPRSHSQAPFIRGDWEVCLFKTDQSQAQRSPTRTRCREIQPWPVVGKKREPRLTGQPGLRTSITTSESDCGRGPCGDVTRGGGIPGMAWRQYVGRHDRHASDSSKMGVSRLEAR